MSGPNKFGGLRPYVQMIKCSFSFPLDRKVATYRQTAPNLHFRCLDRLHRKVNPGASGVWPISDLGDISPARWDAPPATPPRLSYLDRFRGCRYITLFLLLLCTVAKKSWYNFHSFPFLCWLSESLTSFVAIWICREFEAGERQLDWADAMHHRKGDIPEKMPF